MGKVAPKSTLDRLYALYHALFTETPEGYVAAKAPTKTCHLCDEQGTYYTQSGEKECECPT